MCGERYIVLIMTKSADVAPFALQAYIALRETQENMRGRLSRLLINVPVANQMSLRSKFMKEFEFTLNYKLPDADIDPEQYIGQLIEAGCDDAIIGLGHPGCISLQFDREAENAVDAVLSAMRDVRNAIPDAVFIEATPDIVGVSDIAPFVRCSRQNVRKLVTKSTFPLPLHSGKRPLWHLFFVLEWCVSEKIREVEPTMLDLASINMQINLNRKTERIDPEMQSLLATEVH